MEKVLVRSKFQGPANFKSYLPDNTFFMDREKAENDERFLQIIPYGVLVRQSENGPEVLSYVRGKSGSEDRLHGNVSIGVGGHINPIDAPNMKHADSMFSSTESRDIIYNALEREVLEEVGLDVSNFDSEIVGTLYHELNSVGKVHEGYLVYVRMPNYYKYELKSEHCISGLAFRPLASITHSDVYARCEQWTKDSLKYLVYDAFKGQLDRHTPTLERLYETHWKNLLE